MSEPDEAATGGRGVGAARSDERRFLPSFGATTGHGHIQCGWRRSPGIPSRVRRLDFPVGHRVAWKQRRGRALRRGRRVRSCGVQELAPGRRRRNRSDELTVYGRQDEVPWQVE